MVKRLNRAVKFGSFSLQVFPARKNYGYNFIDYSHNLKNYSHNLLEGMRHRDKKKKRVSFVLRSTFRNFAA